MTSKSPDFGIFNFDVIHHLRRMPTNSFSFTMSSPPYFGKLKRYGGKGEKLSLNGYCQWQIACIEESVRVTDGYVAWVANNPVVEGRYIPANEFILAGLHGRKDIIVKRPVIWHKNSGSAQQEWFRNDHEQVMLFTKPGAKGECNWQAVASAPAFNAGGRYHQRTPTGTRKKGGRYPVIAFANPADVLRITVGGGHMGYDAQDDKLACSGFAPFPYKLAEWFVKVFAKPGDTVHDPMCGTGTVGVAALLHECNFTGNDNDPEAQKVAMERLMRTISSPPVPVED